MATMVSEVYDALIAAGAPEDKARAAATAVASQDTRIARVDSDLSTLKWMVGFNLGMTAAILARLFLNQG
jgi:hypothetical protein